MVEELTRRGRRDERPEPFVGKAVAINRKQNRLDSAEQVRLEKEQVAKEVEKREEELGYVITLEDILKTPNLQRKAATAGDRVVDGKLVRVFSSEEDRINVDYVITQEDINSTPNLQNLNAAAGDLIVDGKFMSRAKHDAKQQFLFSYLKDSNTITNASKFLEAVFPMPTYVTPTTSYGFTPETVAKSVEEKYGRDISDLTFDEKRKAVNRRRERILLKSFGPMFDFQPESKAAIAGAISKAVLDPINLAPAGTSVKAAAGIGMGIAGYGSITGDLISSESGEVDVSKALISTAAGGILSGGIIKGANVLADRSANKIIKKAQIVMDRAILDGADPSNPKAILEAAGLSPDKVAAAQKKIGIKIKVKPEQILRRETEQAMVNDSAFSRLYNKKIDKALGSLSTRIKNISERTFGRLRRFEFDSHVRTSEAMEKAEGFARGFGQLAEPAKKDIARMLYNEDFNAARGLMGADLAKVFDDEVVPMLKSFGEELQESGHSFGMIKNFFPRLVKDLKGLQDSLGMEQKGVIDKARKRYADFKKIPVDKISDSENAEIIDRLVRGDNFFIKDNKPSFLRQRKLTLTPDQMKFYASPEESLSVYLRRAVNDLEKRRFLGKSVARNEATGLIDLDMSIGNYVTKEMDEGRLKLDDQSDLVEMLKSRFIGGDQSPDAAIAVLRDLGYMGTIANPISALTQLADLGNSMALNGFRNTLSSFFKTKDVGLIQMGLDEVSKEMAEGGARKTSILLNKMMGASQFKRLDRLGKETFINAAFKNAKQLVKTEKGLAKFKKKIGNTYGKETDALIADLDAGIMSDKVKFYLFNQLSDVQPVTLSEFPQAYLNNPNHRILYMLQSFTLKQLDLVRREVIQEFAKGNKKEAIKQAGLLAGYLTTANLGTQMTKDLILGRDVKAEDIPSKALWSLLGVYGANKYTTDRYWAQGDFKGGIINTLAPAAPLIEAAIGLASESFDADPNYAKLVKPVPVVGNLFYNWFLGGAEEYNEKNK